MKIHLHKNATTTPAQRAVIQNSPHLSVAQLADKIGVSRTTVRRWRNRSSVYDRSHTPKQLNKALSPMEEIKIVLCRLVTRAGLDDLQRIIGSFLNINCSRAGLNRCLKRYHISRLVNLRKTVPYDLKDYTGTYLYYTCFHLPGGEDPARPLQLHSLMDCTFKTLNVRIAASGHEFLYRQLRDFPLKILGIIYQDPVILTQAPYPTAGRQHMTIVESQCRSNKMIAHHLPAPYPRTVNALKSGLSDLMASVSPFDWGLSRSQGPALSEAVYRYNTGFPLGALKQQTPQQALENHYSHFPNSFRLKPEIWAA